MEAKSKQLHFLDVKNEVITVKDEDEIPTIKNERTLSKETRYYFEPQQNSSNKTDNDKKESSIKILVETPPTKANSPIKLKSSSKTADKECPDCQTSSVKRQTCRCPSLRPFKCTVCEKILQTKSGLFTHRKMHLEKPKYRCEICQKEFFQKVNLVNHEKTHNIQNRNYKCSLCDKSFFEKSHLLRHQNFHSESRDFQCNECLKFYKTERCLKVHKQVHSDPSLRPFKCTVCEKGFLSSSKLKQHINVHTNSRPYHCKSCPRDFTNYPNLLKHTIRRHKLDHRTGKPLITIPDYCRIGSKKKKTDDQNAEDVKKPNECYPDTSQIIDIELPSTSGIIRAFQFPDDNYSIENYEQFTDDTILLDIEDDFSDFQLLSPEEYDVQEEVISDQFSIINQDLQFFSENSVNPNNMVQLIPSGQ